MRILKFLDKYAESSILIITLLLMSVFIGLQVFMRYVMQASLSWSEEISRYLFIFLINIGISYGVKENRHVSISLFVNTFSEKVKKYILIFSDGMFLVFALVVASHGIQVSSMINMFGQKSPAVGIPMWIIYLATPLGFTLVSIRLVQRIILRIKGKNNMVSLILFGSFVFFLIMNIPIGISLGISSLITILYSGRVDINYLVQNLTTSIDSFPLMAIPFFILAGDLMGKGGISKRLLNVGNTIFGRYTGGLGIVTIVSCMFFAAISGSGPATVAAIGGLVIPEMIRKKYSVGFSTSLSATAGSIGVMIPPSIPMVIYGVSGGVSITTLFIAGFIPGIFVGCALILWCYISSKKNNYGQQDRKYSLKEIFAAVNDAKWALFIPIIILGGIYGGIFTPTEAAAVAVIYGFIVGVFVYKDLKINDVLEILKKSALTTATVLIILGTANNNLSVEF